MLLAPLAGVWRVYRARTGRQRKKPAPTRGRPVVEKGLPPLRHTADVNADQEVQRRADQEVQRSGSG